MEYSSSPRVSFEASSIIIYMLLMMCARIVKVDYPVFAQYFMVVLSTILLVYYGCRFVYRIYTKKWNLKICLSYVFSILYLPLCCLHCLSLENDTLKIVKITYVIVLTLIVLFYAYKHVKRGLFNYFMTSWLCAVWICALIII